MSEGRFGLVTNLRVPGYPRPELASRGALVSDWLCGREPDAVEAMNHMVNMLREHVPETTRIHYVVTHGGEAPNVVPAFAEVFIYVRSPSRVIDSRTKSGTEPRSSAMIRAPVLMNRSIRRSPCTI